MKIKLILIAMLLSISATMKSFAALNCPSGVTECFKKVIYSRKLENVPLATYLPQHHDVGVVHIKNGAIQDSYTIGFTAVNASDAILGAAKYVSYLAGLSEDAGWVDGKVFNSSSNKGKPKSNAALSNKAEYDKKKTKLKGKEKLNWANSYHLIVYNCQHFASDSY